MGCGSGDGESRILAQEYLCHQGNSVVKGKAEEQTELGCHSEKVEVLVILSCLTVTLWTVALQAPSSVKFSRQESWSRLPFPSVGTEPGYLHCRKILYCQN